MRILVYFSFVILSGATVIPIMPIGKLWDMLRKVPSLSYLGGGKPGGWPQRPSGGGHLDGWPQNPSGVGSLGGWPHIPSGNFSGLDWLLPHISGNGNQIHRDSFVNVCMFSSNPTEYKPRCFLCPSKVLETIKETCEKTKKAPSNVTFSQALCMENNCGINYPKDGTPVISSARDRRQVSLEQTQRSEVSYSDANPAINSPQNENRPKPKNQVRSPRVARSLISFERLFSMPSQYSDLQKKASHIITSAFHNSSDSSSLPITHVIDGKEYKIAGTKIFFLLPDDK